MIDLKNKKAISEVYEILNQLNEDSLKKVPPELLEKLRNHAGYDVSYIKPEIPLEKLELEPETKDILAVISYQCFCNEEEKKKWNQILLKNEMEYRRKNN